MSLSFDEACSAMEEAIWCEAWRADFERSAALLSAEDLRVATGAALADQCARYGFRDAVTRTIVEHYRGGGRIYATFGWMPVVRAVQ